MNKFFTFFLLLLNVGAFCQQGGMALNPNGNLPDSSAALDINFINKGLLMPRMSTAQRNAIAGPATGLIIFNTDCNVINFNAGTPAAPNWATVNSSNVLTAALSISANPSGAICAGTGVAFTATPVAGINVAGYQWQVNGGNAGTNSSVFTDSSLNNGDVVTCILTSNAPCVTGSPATSNAIAMTVNSVPGTPGPISGNSSLCADASGNVYSVSPVPGATSYNWTVPGDAAIAAGSGNASITVTFGSDSGDVSVAADNGCGVGAANSLFVDVNPNPTVANAGANQTVVGYSATLSANIPVNGTGLWSIAGGTDGNIANTSSATSTFTGSIQSYTLTWTISTPTCGSSSSNVTITFQLPAGCALASDGTVWCVASNDYTTGAELCGYPEGYEGTYYAITEAGATALGMTIEEYGDCASNYTYYGNLTEIMGWTGPPDCYSLQESWGRYEGNTSGGCFPIVRCTDYE